MKNFKKATSAIAIALVIGGTALLASCQAISVSGDLVLNQDGTGSRKITGIIEKNDAKEDISTGAPDGYGESYYYLKKHGSELETYLETLYSTKVPGSADWLEISVNDAETKETVEFSFDFTSFNDYTSKLGSLVKFGVADATYTAPTLTENANGSVTYTESTAVLTSFYKALQTYMMDDATVFDIDCTKNGVKLNTKPASKQDLLDYGVELSKNTPMKIKIGAGKALSVANDGANNFTLTANWDGSPVSDKVTECVLDYTFNDTLNNAGTLGADGNLTLGAGSSQTSATFAAGIDGKGYYFDGTSYLASANRTFSYEEITVSFYYKMEEYNQTDTGANMIIVPAGLGALGGGVIDIEFIQEADAPGVQILAKINGSNWQSQDKLYSEEIIKLNEWHCYTVVYQNAYDADGEVENAYVILYIDGERAMRAELSFAAGLKYSLGMHDDGAAGTANGGFNVGGYYESETVKRGSKGVLDNLKVFDGALSANEVKTLCYTIPVNNGGGNDSTDSGNGGSTSEKENGCGKGCGSVVAGGTFALTAMGAAAIVLFRKRK